MGRPIRSRTRRAAETVPDLAALYMTTAQIMAAYGISRTKALEHMQNIIKFFDLDPKRLPKKGVLPTQFVQMYFNQGIKVEDLERKMK